MTLTIFPAKGILLHLIFLWSISQFSLAKKPSTKQKDFSGVFLDSLESPGNNSEVFVFLDDYFTGDSLIYSVNESAYYLEIEQRVNPGKLSKLEGVLNPIISVNSDSHHQEGQLPSHIVFLDDHLNVLMGHNVGTSQSNPTLYKIEWFLALFNSVSNSTKCFNLVFTEEIHTVFAICFDSASKETILIAIDSQTHQETSRVYSKPPNSYDFLLEKTKAKYISPDILVVYTPKNSSIAGYASHGYFQAWEVSENGFNEPSTNSSDVKEPLFFANASTFKEVSLDITKLVEFQNTLYLLDQFSRKFFEFQVDSENGFRLISKHTLTKDAVYLSFDISGDSFDWASTEREVSLFLVTSLEAIHEYSWQSSKPAVLRRKYYQEWPGGAFFQDIKVNGACLLLFFSQIEPPWLLSLIQVIKRENTEMVYALVPSFESLQALPIFSKATSSFMLITHDSQQEFQVNVRSAILHLYPKKSDKAAKYIKLTGSNSFSSSFQILTVYFLNYNDLSQTGPLLLPYSSAITGNSLDSLQVEINRNHLWGPELSYSVSYPNNTSPEIELDVFSTVENVFWNIDMAFLRRDYVIFTQMSQNIRGSSLKEGLLLFVNVLEYRRFVVAGCDFTPNEDLRCMVRGALNNYIQKNMKKIIFSKESLGIVSQSPLFSSVFDICFYPLSIKTTDPLLSLRNISDCFYINHPDFSTFACSFPFENAIKFYGDGFVQIDEINSTHFKNDFDFEPTRLYYDFEETASMLLVQSNNSILFLNLQVFRTERKVFIEYQESGISDGFDWDFDGQKLILMLIWPKNGTIRQILVPIAAKTTKTSPLSSAVTVSQFTLADLGLGSVIENNYTRQYFSYSKTTNRLYIITESGVAGLDIGKPLGFTFYTRVSFEKDYSIFSSVFAVRGSSSKELLVFSDIKNYTTTDLFQVKAVSVVPQASLNFSQPSQQNTSSSLVFHISVGKEMTIEDIPVQVIDSQLEISLNFSQKMEVRTNLTQNVIQIEKNQFFDGLFLFFRPFAPDWGDVQTNFNVTNRLLPMAYSPFTSNRPETKIKAIIMASNYTAILTTKCIILSDPMTLEPFSIQEILIPSVPWNSEEYFCDQMALEPSNESYLVVFCRYSISSFLVLIEINEKIRRTENGGFYPFSDASVLSVYELEAETATKMVLESNGEELLLFFLEHYESEQQDSIWIFKVAPGENQAFLLLDLIGKEDVDDPCSSFMLTDFEAFYNEFSMEFVLIVVDQTNGIRIWIWEMFQEGFSLIDDVVGIYNEAMGDDYLFPAMVQAQNIKCKPIKNNLMEFECLLMSRNGGHFEISLKIPVIGQHRISLLNQYLNYGNYKVPLGSFAVHDDYFAVLASHPDSVSFPWDTSPTKSPHVILFYNRSTDPGTPLTKPFFGLNGNLLGPNILSSDGSLAINLPMLFLEMGKPVSTSSSIDSFKTGSFFCIASNSFWRLRLFEMMNESLLVLSKTPNNFSSVVIKVQALNDFSQASLPVEGNPNEGKEYTLMCIFLTSFVGFGLVCIFVEFLLCKKEADVVNQIKSVRRKNQKKLEERLRAEEAEKKKDPSAGISLSIFKGKGNEGVVRDEEGYIVRRLKEGGE